MEKFKITQVKFETTKNGNHHTLEMLVGSTYAGKAHFYVSEEKRSGREVKLWVVNVDLEDEFKGTDCESRLFDRMEAQIVDLSDDENISRFMTCAIVDEDDDASVYYRNDFDDAKFSIHDDPGFLVVEKAF